MQASTSLPLPPFDEPVPKPDVFEFFAQRAARHKELEKEIERLKHRETSVNRRAADAELAVNRLRAELAATTARMEGREAQLQLRIQQMESAVKKEIERATVLEIRLNKTTGGDAGGGGVVIDDDDDDDATLPLSSDPRRLNGDAALQRAEQTNRELQLRVAELELTLDAARSDTQSTLRSLQGELQSERARREGETAAVEIMRQRAEEAETRAQAAAVARRQTEAHAAELEATMLNIQATAAGRSANEDGGGAAVLIRSLREQLTAAEAQAVDAGRWREQAATAAALRHKLDAAESRARCAEQLLESDAQVHAELATAQAELQRWTAVLSGTGGCTTPEQVLHLLKKLQDGQVAATAGVGDKVEELSAVRTELEAVRTEARELATASEAAIRRAEAAEASLSRAERRTQLLTQEKDSLKAVLASYDDEYLAKGVAVDEAGEGAPISSAQRRIAELEATVEALHGHVRSLEAELGTRSAEAGSHADAVADANAANAAAQARARAAEAEAENLAKQVACLQERVGRGEYNPDTTKVLHMRHNPETELHAAVKEARIAELESENDALRQNVQRLEQQQQNQGHGSSSPSLAGAQGLSVGGSLRVAQLEGEANLLRRRLAESQKTSDRLQQVFTKQISIFRDAIKGLFGYAVTMTSDPGSKDHRAMFVLNPQYADEPGAELAFKMLRDGRIALLPTEYSGRRLKREVETFVERYKSIPAFTANLTMENFQKHTQT